MGWGRVRQQVREKQGNCCSICGNFLPKNFEVHHRVNRCHGGAYTLSNAEARCPQCEDYMHANYPYGNYDGNLKRGGEFYASKGKKTKRGQSLASQKRQRRKQERLGRVLHQDQRGDDLHEMARSEELAIIQERNGLSLLERVERIERLLFPHTS